MYGPSKEHLYSDDVGTLLRVLEGAIEWLGEALWHEESEFTRDAAIRRFDACFDSACQILRVLARLEGEELPSLYAPLLEFGLRKKWISGEALWISIRKDRALPRAGFDNALAEKLFNRIYGHYGRLIDLHRALQAQDPKPPGLSASARKTIEAACVRHLGRNHAVQWHIASNEVYVGWPQSQYAGTAGSMHEARELATEWLMKKKVQQK